MSLRLPAVALLALCAMTSAAPAQDAPPPPPAQATPTFRAGTSAVLLDVVVRDRKGRAVTDLRRDEVTVLENGEPVDLTAFGLVRGTSSTLTAARPVGASTASSSGIISRSAVSSVDLPVPARPVTNKWPSPSRM